MACFNPLVAYRGKTPNAVTGKYPMVFTVAEAAQPDDPQKLPCGRCIGCRLERSRQWAVRCVHEASLYERNCFITLTYAPEHLPKSGSLDKRDYQLFMKRLRKEYGAGIRYFHCGEYGETTKRPHYHACLFNFDFPDRELWSVRNGVRLDHSKSLEEIWGKGFCTIGDVTFESAAYVARYITKKITGEYADKQFLHRDPDDLENYAFAKHYERVDWQTGEIHPLEPEYTTMSRRPGIGHDWLKKYSSDVYPHDRVILRGMALRPPRYYDNIFDVDNPETLEDLKDSRRRKAAALAQDNTFERLRVRERHQYIRLEKLKRGYENGS